MLILLDSSKWKTLKSCFISRLTIFYFNRYVVSALTVFYVRTSENVVIQVQGYTDSFAMTMAIKSYPDHSFTYSFGQGNLSPEKNLQSSANLTVCILIKVYFICQIFLYKIHIDPFYIYGYKNVLHQTKCIY